MLKVANVKGTDVVYDLGSGDGRIVITAAKRFGARGVGIDIDPERIKEANENAKAAGVADKVKFMQGDIFEMEDQRNWTDASYKTYVRPLALPWPYTLPAGTELDLGVVGVHGYELIESYYRDGPLPAVAGSLHREAGTLEYLNRDRIRSRGIEGEIEAVWPDGTRARFAVACQRSEVVETRADLTNSPRWNAHLVVTHAPEDRRLSLGLGLRCLSPRLTLAGARTATATVADARVGLRLGRGVDAGVEARNLFDARYGDPASEEHVGDQIEQDRRAFFATLTVRPVLPR